MTQASLCLLAICYEKRSWWRLSDKRQSTKRHQSALAVPSKLAQALQRCAQGFILLRKAKTHHALVKAVASAASYVVSNASIVDELDINPIMVLADGDGVVAADALIRLRK